MSLLWFLLLAQAAAINYNETRAIEYAKLAGASYCWESSILKWNCGYKCTANVKDVRMCQGSTTKAFVAKWDGNCLLAVRGTLNIKAAWTDLQFWKSATTWSECGSCRVHSGFLKEWNSMESCVKSNLASIGCDAGRASLYVTGHSLGAAVSSIAMLSLRYHGWNIAESYNFGMPRTGDVNFANYFNQRYKSRFFRITHRKDPVVQVPPDQLIVNWHFEHVDSEIFYKGASVRNGYNYCSEAEDKSCAAQHWNLLTSNVNDHLDYMDIDTSPLGCPTIPSEDLEETVVV